jgi:hypothetical protein
MTTEGREVFEIGLWLVFTWVICFCIGIEVGRCSKQDNITRPVEEIIKADSIIKVNDSIKIKVEQLDSIKDAKIIEVQTLDNDSTLKLFYKLISK